MTVKATENCVKSLMAKGISATSIVVLTPTLLNASLCIPCIQLMEILPTRRDSSISLIWKIKPSRY